MKNRFLMLCLVGFLDNEKKNCGIPTDCSKIEIVVGMEIVVCVKKRERNFYSGEKVNCINIFFFHSLLEHLILKNH